MKRRLKGYLIEKYSNMGNAYTCYRLLEEAEKCGMDLQLLGACDLLVTHDGVFSKGEKIAPCDFVINRYKTGCMKAAVNALAKRSYNSQEAMEIYINKYCQLRDLSSAAFLIPDYRLGTLSINYQEMVRELSSPFVVKGLESSQGKEVFLIEKEADYHSLINQWGTEKEILFEEYISTSHGRDIRFYSIRGEVAACMTREAVSGFKANVALGAKVSPYPVTDEIRQIARDIYEQTKLDFLGIDLLFGKEKPYFCEINITPGMEGIEHATGVNVARLIMNTIKEDFGD